GQGVGRRVVGVAEAEVAAGEGVGGVLVGGDRVVGALRRVIHRGDVDGHGVGGLVGVDAAVSGAAVVLDLEGEGGVAGAVGVGGREELELAAADVGCGDELAVGDGDAVVLECALCPYTTLFRSGQGVGRRVVGVAEAEVA